MLYYESDKYGLTPNILRVTLAKTFGWTLSYIDTLSLEDIMMIQGVLNGLNRYEEKMYKEGRS